MPVFSHNGSGHRCLSFLTTGPGTLEEIRDHLGATGSDRSALWHVVGALIDDGLVVRRAGLYVITERGEEALGEMNLGQDWGGEAPVASCRVFVRRERAA